MSNLKATEISIVPMFLVHNSFFKSGGPENFSLRIIKELVDHFIDIPTQIISGRLIDP